MVGRGVGEMVLEGKRVCLPEGTLVVLNPGDVHACVAPRADFEYVGFNIPVRLAGRWCGVRRPRYGKNLFYRPELAEYLWAEGGEDFSSCLQEVMRRLWLQGGESPGKGEPPLVRRACRLMKEECQRRLLLEEIARYAGSSRAGLVRAFARSLGLSPHQYLMQQRLETVRRLLQRGETLAGAACMAGFTDQSHMSRCFVRCYGYRPGDYRQACGNIPPAM